MAVLADDKRVGELIGTLAEAIGSAARGDDAPWALIGVRSRGDVLARRIADRLGADRFEGRVGSLDLTLYRDDLSEIGPQAVVRTTEVPFPIDEVNVVLVDDVIMTGRSVRAALQSLMDLGRPRRVWLSVLVDRGGRELPIQPDHVALDLTRHDPPIEPNQRVQVQLQPTDERDAIELLTSE
ncbi:MAG: bifunctional pyr operon transcriptional regulator/uracil phosphoribosyltransferase PyrR [Phycisphaeraceae bacterium]